MTAVAYKHFGSSGALGATRRPQAKAQATPAAEDTEGVVKVLRRVSKRLEELDLKTEGIQGWTDFEVDVSTAGATVSLMHNYGTPVRWYVVHWGKTTSTTPTAAPALVMDSTSTVNILTLKSYVAGKAIVRVEPSPYPVAF